MSRPEVIKLARLLDVEESALAPLLAVPEEDLRTLRRQVTDRLFEGDRPRLQRIADAARVLPVPLVAKVGRRAFGPLLCARLAGLLDPGRAVDVAARWPDEFAAAVAAEIDPRRASAIVAAMPPGRVVAIAQILAREGEHVAMGRFVGHLDGDSLQACVATLDEAAILRTAYVIEGPERIDEIVSGMPEARLRRIAEAASAEGLGEELEHLRTHLSRRQATRLAAAVRAAA